MILRIKAKNYTVRKNIGKKFVTLESAKIPQTQKALIIKEKYVKILTFFSLYKKAFSKQKGKPQTDC